ncbi:hypothetical protein RhiirC2_804052 [Rhizophagus irregularis]|uniref:Uncharacterized protein n=1 Tax=Rhizophagus irregularis TaxID=588596 RepID=A0A2N1L5G2_9GLOM|nr:hypothetical protein RhiirC2_804052 [Rhizophagus irregularis]
MIISRLGQQKKVNNIIPVVQKSINKKLFSVTDSVIKHVIYERYRHQREELLNARRNANWVENDKRRWHANFRQSDKLERRSKIIDKLTTLKDRLVDKFYNNEL